MFCHPRRALCLLLALLLCSLPAFAHPGRTDGSGGHYNRSTGEYHYHHGYSAHQHTDGICPYDFDDRTGERSGSPSSGTAPKPAKTPFRAPTYIPTKRPTFPYNLPTTAPSSGKAFDWSSLKWVAIALLALVFTPLGFFLYCIFGALIIPGVKWIFRHFSSIALGIFICLIVAMLVFLLYIRLFL